MVTRSNTGSWGMVYGIMYDTLCDIFTVRYSNITEMSVKKLKIIHGLIKSRDQNCPMKAIHIVNKGI